MIETSLVSEPSNNLIDGVATWSLLPLIVSSPSVVPSLEILT